MDWQLLLVILIVTAAAGYLARQAWHSWSGRKACKSGCGCASQPGADAGKLLIPADQLTVRTRR